jgi:hypothetical protein
LERFKFGSRHEYDQDEHKLLTRRQKTAIVVVDEELLGGHRHALKEITRNYCDVAFGWMKTKDTKHMLKEFGRNTSDLPFMVYTDEKKCRAFHNGRVADAAKSGFLEKARQGSLCGKTYVNGAVKAIGSIEPEAPTSSVVERKTKRIRGMVFSTMYVMSGLLLTLVIRVCTVDHEDKQE